MPTRPVATIELIVQSLSQTKPQKFTIGLQFFLKSWGILDAVCLSDEGEKALSILRGIMELAGLGTVALGLDIAITIGRAVAISLNEYNTGTVL